MNIRQIFYSIMCLTCVSTAYALKMQAPESICAQQGLQPGSPEYSACVEREQQRQAELIQKIMVEERAPEEITPQDEHAFAQLDGCLATVELDEMGNEINPSVPASVCQPSARQIARM